MSVALEQPSPASRPLGRHVKGPSALGGDHRRFAALTWTLATTNFKLKFFGSALGYLWQVMRPLLLFGVLYVVFTKFVNLSTHVHAYGVALLIGIVLYTFFSDATGSSLTALIDRESLLRKIQFPRLVVPLSVLLEAAFNLALNTVVVIAFVLATGHSPNIHWLELLALAPLVTVFALGLGTLLSALYVRYRDVRPIWDVILQMLFYGSAVFFPISVIPDHLKRLVLMNPLAALIVQARHALLGSDYESAGVAAGGWVWMAVPLGILLGLAVVGCWYFNRQAPGLAEEL